MTRVRHSIRATVLLAIIAAVIAPTLLLGSLETRLTRATHEPLIEQSRSGVLGLTAAALVEPLWTINVPASHLAAQSALDDPGVLGLRLTEQRPGAPVFEATRPGAAPRQGILRRTQILREGEVLGELEIWFDPAQLDRVLADRRTAMVQLAGLQVLLSVGVLLLVLNWRLLRPIARLKDQASRMALREDSTPILWRRQDELGELGQHLNEVHAQVDELFAQLEKQKLELEKLALHDTLTDLPNRLLFQELARSAVTAARRDGHKLALLFIDLDRFKTVNDTLGHAAGDQVLLTVAQRLRATARAADVVCRHSGDEFLILLRDTAHVDHVAQLADRLLRAIDAPMDILDRRLTLSASIGIAIHPDDSANDEELVRHADIAMYAAKNLGRARYSFFRAEFNAQLESNLQIEKDLLRALQQDEFVLHYQPQVAADSGRLVGCEALVRWQHPERGLVPPLQFIGMAEQCGLISELGAWAVHSACAQMAAWRAQGVPYGTVAVNVSASEFRHHRLIDTVTEALHAHGIHPDELELEITESVLMTDSETTQRIVGHLQELGIGLAIDDFGTGYSSLAYLKRLRPHKLKIDRSFVGDLPGDEDDRVLVQAIVHLAHALGVKVVAEGVETAAQHAFLRETGCDVHQGYLIGRPQPPAQFAAFALALQARQSQQDGLATGSAI